MHKTPEELFSFLDNLGIAHSTIAHPAVFTAEDGAEWIDTIPGLHCKNLFLKDKKDRIYLVTLPAAKRANLNALEKRIGSVRLSFGKPELLAEVLGLTPGSVTPFALINDTERRVNVVLDSDMMQAEFVNYHPLHNEASTTIRSADLMKFITTLGYTPQIVDCGSSF